MRRVLIALSMVALLWIPAVRSWVEGSMTRHMLIGLPLLVAAGVMAGAGWARAARQGSAWNPGGIPGALLALGCSAAIMVPRVLDAAVQSLAADAIKSALALLAGAALAASWRALGSLGQAFVVGNAGWMLAAAGARAALCAVSAGRPASGGGRAGDCGRPDCGRMAGFGSVARRACR
jgi:hypothetical protein